MADVGFVAQLVASLNRLFITRSYLNDLRVAGNYSINTTQVSMCIRGRALARSGSRPAAIDLFSKAYSLDPTLADALEEHGAVLDLMGEREGAEVKYSAARRARMVSPSSPPDRHFVFRHRGSGHSEIIAYDLVVYHMSRKALPLIARGNAYLCMGCPQRALMDYDKVLKLKQNSPEIVALKGEALAMLGCYQEALQEFNSALAARPDDSEALGGRAIVQAAIGAIENANADWRRQFQLLKGRAAARGCIALRMADYELALPELEQALLREPLAPYWSLYRLTARRRLGLPGMVNAPSGVSDWPGKLLDLHAGRVSADEILGQADTEARRAEALFQVGIVAFSNDRAYAERCWRKVLDHGAPSLIEYGAARNELARLGS